MQHRQKGREEKEEEEEEEKIERRECEKLGRVGVLGPATPQKTGYTVDVQQGTDKQADGVGETGVVEDR